MKSPRHHVHLKEYIFRGNDPEIYKERKELGRLLANPILESIDHNLSDKMFSFIPNTQMCLSWNDGGA